MFHYSVRTSERSSSVTVFLCIFFSRDFIGQSKTLRCYHFMYMFSLFYWALVLLCTKESKSYFPTYRGGANTRFLSLCTTFIFRFLCYRLLVTTSVSLLKEFEYLKSLIFVEPRRKFCILGSRMSELYWL